MTRRWRDLFWLMLLLTVIGLCVRRPRVSHELDGQTYEALLSGYASTTLKFEDGRFALNRHTCTSNHRWSGGYHLEGNTLILDKSVLPGSRFQLRKSAGRTYLDSSGGDYDRILRLTADGSGGPYPPRWRGGPLRLIGIYPGLNASSLDSKLRLALKVQGRAIYGSAEKDLAVSVKGDRVMAVAGLRLSEKDGPVLLEAAEKDDWIEQCLGQKGRDERGKGLTSFPCGLCVGHGYDLLGAYFLGRLHEIEILRDAILTADLD